MPFKNWTTGQTDKTTFSLPPLASQIYVGKQTLRFTLLMLLSSITTSRSSFYLFVSFIEVKKSRTFLTGLPILTTWMVRFASLNIEYCLVLVNKIACRGCYLVRA